MFKVVLSSAAAEFFGAADKPLAKKLARCFIQLERDPKSHSNIKRLTGDFAGLSRYRVGDWRVIFQVTDDKNRVEVLAIAHRRDIYG